MSDKQKYRISVAKTVEGRNKPRWVNIGWATVLDDGKIIARLDAIPINWNGEFYLFRHDETDEIPY